MKLEPAVKKETSYIAIGSIILCVLLLAGFLILHLALPSVIPFDYRVFLGAVLGTGVTILNFTWMAVTVQQVANETDDDRAKKRMQLSYGRRSAMVFGWGILAIFLPFVNAAAGIIPLFFQSILLKLRATPMVANKLGAVEPAVAGAEDTAAESLVEPAAVGAEDTATGTEDTADTSDSDMTDPSSVEGGE